MSGIDFIGQQMKDARVAAVALLCMTLSACSMSRISPEYLPQGLLKENASSGASVAVSVVDRINNTAPTQSGDSGFSLFQRISPGKQVICDSCIHQFGTPPIEIVKRLVSGALLYDGASPNGDGSKRLEVHVLQFEFFEPQRNTGFDLRLQGRVGLRAIVFDHGSAVADWSYLESSVFSPGPMAFRGDVEEWVSRTASLSVEHVLSDARISGALKGP